MGFPVGYTEVILPNLFLYTLSILGFIKNILNFIFTLVGLQDYLDPPSNISSSSPPQWQHDLHDAFSIQESLPAILKFSQLNGVDLPENCAVCLHEFEAEDEIRPLVNCMHVFHRGCLDRWMSYHHRTCPLCRMPLLNDMMLLASGIPADGYGEF